MDRKFFPVWIQTRTQMYVRRECAAFIAFSVRHSSYTQHPLILHRKWPPVCVCGGCSASDFSPLRKTVVPPATLFFLP